MCIFVYFFKGIINVIDIGDFFCPDIFYKEYWYFIKT